MPSKSPRLNPRARAYSTLNPLAPDFEDEDEAGSPTKRLNHDAIASSPLSSAWNRNSTAPNTLVSPSTSKTWISPVHGPTVSQVCCKKQGVSLELTRGVSSTTCDWCNERVARFWCKIFSSRRITLLTKLGKRLTYLAILLLPVRREVYHLKI